MARALAILFAAVWSAYAQNGNGVVDLLTDKLEQRIQAIDDGMEGVLGVAAIDLSNGGTVEYHADTLFPLASVVKIPIMIEAFRSGRLDEKVTVQPDEARPGGDLYGIVKKGPVSLTVRELVTHMIQSSDNTAANRLIALLGMQHINDTIHTLGLKETRLRRIMLDSDAVKGGHENVSTPMEMARLMQMIYDMRVKGAEQMTTIMKEVDGDVRKTVPPGIEVASKVGEYPGSRTETAIVFLAKRPYAISVCATFLRPGANPIPEVASAVHEYFDKLAHSNAYGNRID